MCDGLFIKTLSISAILFSFGLNDSHGIEEGDISLQPIRSSKKVPEQAWMAFSIASTAETNSLCKTFQELKGYAPSMSAAIFLKLKVKDKDASEIWVKILKSMPFHSIARLDLQDQNLGSLILKDTKLLAPPEPDTSSWSCFSGFFASPPISSPPVSSYELCYHPKDGIKTLTEKMHKNKTITHLNLRGNALNLNHGAADFLEMMISNTTIINLNLSSNNIGDAVAKDIAVMLRFNKTLKILDLADNDINDGGFRILLGALSNNATLATLNLKHNPISDGLISEINEIHRDRVQL